MSKDLDLDGQNIWPDITGKRLYHKQRTFYWRTPGQMAIRKGDWKLVVGLGEDHKTELFNLKKDPLEKENLAEQYPEKVKRLQVLLEEEKKYDQEPQK